VAEAAGVTGDDAAAAAALRKLPLGAIAPTGGVSTPGRPSPILDGRYIASGIAQGFAANRQAKVPLMLGGNSNEASLFRPQPALLDLMPEERRAGVLKVFDPQGTGDRARIVNDLSTVQSMTEPDRNIARLHTRAGAPAYLYYFSYVPPAEQARKPYGAGHTDEIRFVFVSPKARFTPQDLPLGQAMNAYWANFARTGDPGAVDGVAWPKFDVAKEGQIDFTAEGPKVREHFLKDWRDLVEATQPK
jgi:para-nitrobenzyl esterase